jgi:protein-disulfide isomerase
MLRCKLSDYRYRQLIRMRIFLFLTLAGGLLLAQQPPATAPADAWQKAATLPGIDLSTLTAAQRTAALKIMREQDCSCGCTMKVAECRIKDPACAVSRSIANAAIKSLKAGGTPVEAAKAAAEIAKNGPGAQPVLEDPVSISIAGDPVRGPANAKITIVEFSDFQCPYCAAAAAKVNALLAQYPHDVKLVFKQFPLEIHSQARLAAQASLAAAAQNKFWELHDKMFANFRRLSRESIVKMAQETGLDMAKFNQDWQNAQYKTQIDREVEEGVNAGVSGTPTFFIDGKKYNGPVEPESLKPILDKELGRSPKS